MYTGDTMTTLAHVDAPGLKQWMTDNGWTVRGLASALDIHYRTVQRYRDGSAAVPRVVELALQSLGARPTPTREPDRETFEDTP